MPNARFIAHQIANAELTRPPLVDANYQGQQHVTENFITVRLELTSKRKISSKSMEEMLNETIGILQKKDDIEKVVPPLQC